MSKFGKTIKTFGSSIAKGAKNHSPELFTVGGIIFLVGAGVLACYSTTKLKEKRSEIKEERKDILENRNTAEDTVVNVDEEKHPEIIESAEDYLENGYKKDLRKSYAKEIFLYGKLYGPSIGLAAAGIVFVLAGHNIMRKRSAAMAAAYATLERSYAQYRKRVIDTYGKEVDEKFRKAIIESKDVEVTEIDENGNKVKSIETVDILDTKRDYSILFDATPRYQKNPYNNRVFLKGFERMLNDQLYANGILLLNDVYDQLGIPRTSDGAVVGWSSKNVDGREADGYVSLGLDFDDLDLDHWTSDIWLDPNCDGFVQHLIDD